MVVDQDTILELSGKIQELQNEIHCLNDSRDVQDAESVRTQWTFLPKLPVNLCLSHLIQFLLECFAVLLECRAAKMGRQAFGTHIVYRETFLQIQQRLLQHLILKNCINGMCQSRSRFIRLQWRKVRDQNKIEILDSSLDRQPKIQSSSVEETLQRIMGQTNNDCRFRFFTLTSSIHQQPLLAGR